MTALYPNVTVSLIGSPFEASSFVIRTTRALRAGAGAEAVAQFRAELHAACPSAWGGICLRYVKVTA